MRALFRPRLVLIVVAINVLVLLLSGRSLWVSRQQAETQATQAVRNLTTVVQANIEFSSRSIDFALQELADSLERRLRKGGIEDAEVAALLAAHSRRHPEVSAFRVTRSDGVVWWGEGVDRTKPVSYAGRDYFDHHRAQPGQLLTVTPPLVGRVSKQVIVAFVRSYRYPDGRFAGVITAAIPVSHFQALLSGLSLGARGIAAMRHDDLTIVALHPSPSGTDTISGSKRISPELKQVLDSGSVDAVYRTANAPDGADRLYAYRHLSGLPLMVIIGLSPDDYLEGWRREAQYACVLLLAFMFASAWGTRMLLGMWNQNGRDFNALQAKEAALAKALGDAQQANIAKSQFLAVMSHEIRTPLNGVLGMAQMLQLPGVSDSERVEYASTIMDSGQTLLALLNDMLDLSKIEAGRLHLERMPFTPVALVHEMEMLFKSLATEKRLDYSTRWHGPDFRYEGDVTRLRQMLSNLVSNAIKFTAEGSVRLDGRMIEQDAQGAVLEFSVVDTGIGVAADKMALLFQPFSQGDASTTRQFGGTGLGLSIVQRLARLMGGDVGVDSLPGTGSTFWVRVRVGLGEAPPESPSDALAAVDFSALASIAGKRVLVVEDNPTNRAVILAVLKRLNIDVDVAEDGAQAVRCLEEGRTPDLILMDIQMPVMDGYAATRQIRAWEQAQRRTPVVIVALTAGAFAGDKRAALDAGMNDYLAKPIAFEDLQVVLRRWLLREAITS